MGAIARSRENVSPQPLDYRPERPRRRLKRWLLLVFFALFLFIAIVLTALILSLPLGFDVRNN